MVATHAHGKTRSTKETRFSVYWVSVKKIKTNQICATETHKEEARNAT